MIVKFAAIAAAAGPAILAFSKVVKVVGIASTGIGKFATAVGKAGGGFSGFLSVLSKSPAVWFAVAAAVVVGTVALADYVSGAKEAREALRAWRKPPGRGRKPLRKPSMVPAPACPSSA